MNERLKRFSIPGLGWCVGLVILWESVLLFWASTSGLQSLPTKGPLQWIHFVLAGGEIIVAILFLAPVTRVLGGYLLLVIFALAALVHILHGDFRFEILILYAAAVLVVIANEGYGSSGTRSPDHHSG